MATPLRLLIIEDNPDNADLLVRRLKQSGFEVSFTQVQTAEDVCSARAHERRDFVISDYEMICRASTACGP